MYQGKTNMEYRTSNLSISTLNARDSLKQIRRMSEDSEIGANTNTTNYERLWRLSYLKNQFQILDAGNLFKRYTERINHGYFSVFLILYAVLSAIHLVVVVLSNMDSNLLNTIIPDLVIYAMTCTSLIIGLCTTDTYVQKNPRLLTVLSVITFLMLYVSNFLIPMYHYFSSELKEQLRPAYTTHMIIACYIFFNVTHNGIALILGAMVTMSHVVLIILVTYRQSPVLVQRVLSDSIYLVCINGIGLYFRYLNEIIKRIGFLDRRACVESMLKLQFEKEQGEQLMSSIIPNKILERVHGKIEKMLRIEENQNNQEANTNDIFYNTLNDTYRESHKNVTILFADIVNFTEMTTKLKPPRKLVRTLNELFGRFDDASEELNVLRIKFLGDCYYCVGGLPPHPANSVPNYAEACVDLGLRMIDIIRHVREISGIPINMRIGVHTGNILSFLIGQKKWQYDIWSKDVDIANRMEQTGCAGAVHITKQTKDLLEKRYNVSPYSGSLKDPFLQQHNIETFLVTPSSSNNISDTSLQSSFSYLRNIPDDILESSPKPETNGERRDTIYMRRPSGIPNASLAKIDRRVSGNPNLVNFRQQPLPKRRSGSSTSIRERRVTPGDGQRRTAFMDSNIHRYQERLQNTAEKMKNAIEDMPLTKYKQWFKEKEINPIFLVFPNVKKEKKFLQNTDPLFKYYLLAAVIILISITLIQNITLSEWDVQMWLNYASLAIITLILIPVSWMTYVWNKYICRYLKEAREPENAFLIYLYKLSQKISENVIIRVTIYVSVYLLLLGCVVTEMVECEDRYGQRTKSVDFLSYMLHKSDTYVCAVPWHMSETCALVLFTSFCFIRIHLWIKSIFVSLTTVLYSLIVWNFRDGFYESSETINYNVQPKIAHIMSISFITIALHLIDRQNDYMTRLDYNLNQHLKKDKAEANVQHKINCALIYNILPMHVADLYMNVNREERKDHYEEYCNVGVMFASIIDYDMEDNPISDSMLLAIMNEIIGEFDKLLNVTNEIPIEKIKVAKWTYMAACGLEPGRRDSYSELDRQNDSYVVVQLVKLAAKMMKVLEAINAENSQEIKLRIGIAHGPLIAAVIGVKKPLYDIWGDPVNMASRMDTTGVKGKIQIPEETARVLQEHNIKCEYRDTLSVKGIKEPVPTFFVSLDKNCELIYLSNDQTYM